ncbi:ABC transporter ATP-binding protein [Undibacterium fentianense]|uniref:ABC transporter ATP-binding protein n=1 Tax=Undibacterium fentianense TaxID=2828728 RepID=A0A941IDN5_9BURK|nr:ABC transporter ATP-binding protein [Undibacterium fentianense]MBR7798572.1 ABC transporter ATP-binding protein [Undibacterium fentianense]
MLSIQNLSLQIGGRAILKNLNFELSPGQKLALIGPNGAGKSSLFNVISGKIPFQSGRIYLNQIDISEQSAHQISRLGLSRSFQTSQLFPRLSVFDNLCCASMWRTRRTHATNPGKGYAFWRRLSGRKEVIENAEHILDLLKLHEKRQVYPVHLTYVEQRCLEIGMCIASDAQYILLDEPTAGMGQHETRLVVNLLNWLGPDKSLVVIEHDMQMVFNFADQIAVMDQGQIIAWDTPERVRKDPRVQSAFLSPDLFLKDTELSPISSHAKLSRNGAARLEGDE